MDVRVVNGTRDDLAVPSSTVLEENVHSVVMSIKQCLNLTSTSVEVVLDRVHVGKTPRMDLRTYKNMTLDQWAKARQHRKRLGLENHPTAILAAQQGVKSIMARIAGYLSANLARTRNRL